MTNQDKIQMHEEVCKYLHNLYIEKNHDYGDSVHDTFNKFGMDSFTVRMYDKLNRIYALTRPDTSNKVADEKIEDTLLDLANYAILAYIELKDKQSQLTQDTKSANY